MKLIGNIISPKAFNAELCDDAKWALDKIDARTRGELLALGIDSRRVDELLEQAQSRLMATVTLCESPIEQVMLVALSHMVAAGAFPPMIHDIKSGDPFPGGPVVIVPQFVIARYRLDFFVMVNRNLKFAVECDGAAYHSERIDRIRDAARDDYLEALGIHTIRYSGSWIKKNSWKVADEIAAYGS